MKKYILLVLLALPSILIAQTPTQTENYVLSTTYQKGFVKGLEWTAQDKDKIASVAYLDGLGRPVQNVAVRAGGANEDIITFIDYDVYGRQIKEYLPYAALSTGGTFRTNAYTTTNSFYTAKYGSAVTNPYSEKHFEASPLNRMVEQAAPGTAWALNKTNDLDKTVKFGYQTNTANEVKKYTVSLAFASNTYTPTLQGGSSYYGATQLYKTITKDENWTAADGTNRTTEEFKDKLGRVILKRTYADVSGNSTAHDTYYVYDDYGNLSYVLPPKAEPQTAKPDATELSELCYQYKYDHRNRLVEKKIPGKEWEYIIYDLLDRPALTQDVNQRSAREWSFTKYDALGRIIYTGIYTHAFVKNRVEMQNHFSHQNDLAGELYEVKATSNSGYQGTYYSNSDYPKTNIEILAVNYYDNYFFDKAGTTSTINSYGIVSAGIVKGFATGSRVKVLGSSNWITTVTYYDDKSRPIYAYNKNDFLNTTDIVKSKLDDFTGRVLETKTTHKKTGKTDIVTIDRFEYDHQGRVAVQTQDLSNAVSRRLVKNNYNNLGELESKLVDNGTEDGYKDLVGVSVVNDLITNVSGSSWGSAGLATKGSFSGDGYVEFEAPQTNKAVMVGLSPQNLSAHYNTIKYAIYLVGNGNIKAYESGVNKGAFHSYQTGDIFRVERVGTTVYYKHNGVTFYTSPLASTSSLLGDIAFSHNQGKLKDFKIVDNTKGLQKVDYKYNVRGWLTDINDVNSLGDDLFTFNIRYDDPTSGTALYNGNISQTFWKTKNTDQSLRNYKYTYDALNRIESGIDNTGGQRYSLNNVDYDKNGNITRIDRRGAINTAGTSFGGMDVIFYSYHDSNKSNRLRWVVDYGNDDFGFVDGNPSGTDYWYDLNGNMTKDLNKGITNINYNHLNLPTQVTIIGQNISYVYDAVGAKLRKTVSGTTTDYAGNYVYENGDLQYFNTSEGYVTPDGSSFKYIYQYKDHLGNIRLSYNDANGDGTIAQSEIIEENNYYPFGLKHKGYNAIVNSNGNSVGNKRKFGGNELQDELGLEWYDITARNYDPALGRWMNLDPLAEEMTRHSPYNYAFDNPIYYIDPDGMKPVGAYGEQLSESGAITWWSSDPNDWEVRMTGGNKGSGNSGPGQDFVINTKKHQITIYESDKDFDRLIIDGELISDSLVRGSLGSYISSLRDNEGYGVRRMNGVGMGLTDFALTWFSGEAALKGLGKLGAYIWGMKTIVKAKKIASVIEKLSPFDLKSTQALNLSKKEFQKLVAGIKKDGILEPIEYSVKNNVKYIQNGHHRAFIAKKLGLKNVPAKEIPYKVGDEFFESGKNPGYLKYIKW